jgi:hypothetical protein
MIRCGVDKRIPCEFRRDGNCENAQDECPCDIVANMWEAGKSIDQIINRTNYNELEIDDILEILKLKAR